MSGYERSGEQVSGWALGGVAFAGVVVPVIWSLTRPGVIEGT